MTIISLVGGALLYLAKVGVQIANMFSHGIAVAENRKPREEAKAERTIEYFMNKSKDPLLKFAIKRFAKKAKERLGN